MSEQGDLVGDEFNPGAVGYGKQATQSQRNVLVQVRLLSCNAHILPSRLVAAEGPRG